MCQVTHYTHLGPGSRRTAEPTLASPPEEIRRTRLRHLQNQFPGVRVWYGAATGSWWALHGGELVEASTPEGLAEQIRRRRAGRVL